MLEPDKAILNVKEFIINDTVTDENFDELKNNLYISVESGKYTTLSSDAVFDSNINYYDLSWIEIPAIKGSSVNVSAITTYEAGTQIDLYEEATHSTHTIQLPYGKSVHGTVASSSAILPGTDKVRWQFDVSIEDETTGTTYGFTIYDGVDGQGQVNFVDGIGVTNNSKPYDPTSDVPLGAVSYKYVQTLSSAEKSQARLNIGAQASGSYIIMPANPSANQVLNYNGTAWVTSWPLPVAAPSNTLLIKTASTGSYGVGWISAISSAEIDALFE